MARSNVKVNRDGDLAAAAEEIVSLAPATGEEVGRFPVTEAGEVRAAIETARGALGWWTELGFAGRRSALLRWRAEIARGAEELVELIHRENGKTLDTARAELLNTLDLVDWSAENAERVLGGRDVETSGAATMHLDARVEYRPYGVVGVIGPWNWPSATPMGIIPFAMAAGNTVVFKPSEYTPAVGTWLADSWNRVSGDHPVFQVVTGFAATGQALIEQGVDKVAFTGSVRTGSAVMRAAADHLTPMLLELGGKDAGVVTGSANVELAAADLVWGAVGNAGQGCISIERAIVVEELYDQFVATAEKQMGKLRAGADGQIGPITLPQQVETIRAHIADAEARGARVLCGGVGQIDGLYVQPTLVVDVPRDAQLATEETFGPVLAVIKATDEDDAFDVANSTAFGLGSAVYGGENALELARRLRAGMTSVNCAAAFVLVSGLPFGGGSGESGFGRKHGDDGLLEFARPHAIAIRARDPMVEVTSAPPLEGVLAMVSKGAIEKASGLEA